ncbi:androgen-induced gene 1 protein isoform 14-T20 [Alca torda]
MALVPCQVLRAAILLSYCSILCNYKAIDMPAHQTYGGSWKFLTFIDLVTGFGWAGAVFLFCVEAASDVTETCFNKESKLKWPWHCSWCGRSCDTRHKDLPFP